MLGAGLHSLDTDWWKGADFFGVRFSCLITQYPRNTNFHNFYFLRAWNFTLNESPSLPQGVKRYSMGNLSKLQKT